ncbi:hypothetical protein QCA50_003101 [Cerrena zonata]|uniref:Uncharacterized protein n=1 Tax=Cerrena zonata TaxID=2478898 RepID=A0AAW0GLM4_9APHY
MRPRRVEGLQIEIQQSRESQHHQYEPSEARNANGKRRMTDAHHPNNGIRSFSSPRSVTTPLGPDRLTLPPKHSRPPSYAQQHVNSDDSLYHHSQSRQVDMQNMSNERPGSSRFAKQFSYNPPPTQLMDPNHVPDMSRNPTHSSRPATFLSSSNSNHNPRLGSVPPPSAKKMPPPPPPRVAKAPPQLERSHLTNNLSPQQIFSTGPTSLRTQSFSEAPRSNHFLPSSRNNHLVQNEQAIKTHQDSSTPSSNRFAIPPTPQLGSRTASLAQGWNGGQRHPFMPKSG